MNGPHVIGPAEIYIVPRYTVHGDIFTSNGLGRWALIGPGAAESST